MIVSCPASFKGYVRLAEVTLASHPKTSMLACAQAVRLNPSLLPKVASRLKQLSDEVPYASSVTAEERDAIPPELQIHLLRPFPTELDHALSNNFWTAPTETRHRSIHMGFELPRNFSWVYPGRLAGMSTPKTESDIDALIDMSFTHILSLTAEEPLESKWFRLKPVEHVFIPVENYGAPSKQEMDVIFERVRVGGTWLVHCGGGVGRAGTVLACLSSMFGRSEGADDFPRMDAKEAIKLVRRARPRSLESERQEVFVHEWVSHRWKVAHQTQAGPSEPATNSKTIFRTGVTIMDLTQSTAIMLIGKPGSGKSWLSTAILKRRPKGKTIIVSQDESRSRRGCERTWGSRHSDDTLVILDRCNPTAEDRKYWLSLCLAQHVVAIYFDYPLELCQQRVDSRIDHPRIRAGRGANALAQMDKDMCEPTLSEGFSAIYTVSSFSAAREVVRKLAGDPPLLKFPRTPHLLDLGATTSDDIVKPDFDTLRGHLTVEEKIDGANMGFSIDWDGAIRSQNRSHWVSSADHAQFKPLDKWIADHDIALRQILERDQHYPERYILYGEWMVAKHSIHYTALPNRFIAFDLYDRLEETFLSRSKLALALRGSGIRQVPLITETEQITRNELLQMLRRKSAWTNGLVEGVYIRIEDDERATTVGRGKIVRSDFIAGNEHWSKGKVTLNGLSDDASAVDLQAV